mgnify:CR=1 FL=1
MSDALSAVWVTYEPGDPVINEHLGDAYWRVGRILEAKYQWEQALSLEPEPPLSLPKNCSVMKTTNKKKPKLDGYRI